MEIIRSKGSTFQLSRNRSTQAKFTCELTSAEAAFDLAISRHFSDKSMAVRSYFLLFLASIIGSWPVPVPMSRIRVGPRYFSGFVHRMVEDKNLKHHLLTSHNTQLPDLASSEERNNDIMF